MKIKEVSANDWKKLCEQINTVSRGALISVQETPVDGNVTNDILEQAPLQSFAWDEQSDACNNLLVIEAGIGKPVRHVIVEPIHILLKNGTNDRFNQLEVFSEIGRTLISFNPGILSTVLDGTGK